MTKAEICKALEEMSDYFQECWSNASFERKSEEHFWELKSAAKEAAELLKEQEPVKPTYNAFHCGVCDHVVRYHQSYCGNCGRKVMWDG